MSARASEPPRVALVTTSYPRAPGDAAGHFVESEARALAQGGHEVHVFAPHTRTASETRTGVHLHWLADHDAFGFPGALARMRENPLRAFGALKFALCARRELERARPFARVQAHFLVPSAWPIASARGSQRNAELELVGHGSDVRLFCRLPSRLRNRIVKHWLARGACLRVTSEELAALVLAKQPELGARIRVAASPIELEAAPSRSRARAELELAESQKIAVIVARLVPEKRVAEALEALTPRANWSLFVIGDGPEATTLRARFPHVRFTGQLSRARALTFIAAADVLVSASEKEGAPTVVREARALGVPVIAAPAGDLALWAERDPGIHLVFSPFGVNARQKLDEVTRLRA